MRKVFLALLFSLLCFTAYGGEGVQPIFGIDPPNDMADSLGSPSKRWVIIYTGAISDGQGNTATPAQLSDVIATSISKDHTVLTAESRAAPEQHPMASITGLVQTLSSKAGTALATTTAAGLMSPDDKSKLDGFDLSGYAPLDSPFFTGSPQAPTPALSDASSNLATTFWVFSNLQDVVRFTAEGDIQLPNSRNLLGTDIEGRDFNLIELSQWDIIDVASSKHHLNFNSIDRPTVQVGTETGQTAESLAFLSDIPMTTSWEVDSVANLVTLTQARVGDVARISAGPDAGTVYQLIAPDPTILDNWLNITQDGGVIAVNGKVGTVTVDLADFPNVQAALNLKANASDLSRYATIGSFNALQATVDTKAPSDSPVFTGTPTSVTPAAGDNSQQIATTAFVAAAVDSSTGQIPIGGLLWYSSRTAPPGFIAPTGALLSRAVYPELFAFASQSGMWVTEANWASNQGSYSNGDGSTTFRIPYLGDYFIRPWTANLSRNPGTVQNDAIRNIAGNAGTVIARFSASGPFSTVANGFAVGPGSSIEANMTFNAANQVPTATENRPINVSWPVYIRYK